MRYSRSRLPASAWRLILSLPVLVLGLPATVEAAELGMVREVFACNLNEDKTMADVMAARDYMTERLSDIGVPNRDGYVWTPVSGGSDFDYIWFDNVGTLNQFGEETDTWQASATGREVDDNWGKIEQCVSGVLLRETIYEGEEALQASDAGAFIAASGCNFREGMSMTDLRPVIAQVSAAMDGLGVYGSFLGYMSVPLVAGPDRDVLFYGVHPDAGTWAARATAFQTSPSGAAAGEAFDAVLGECESSLWRGQMVTSAEGE